MKINKIICCCIGGFGTSVFEKIYTEKVLKKHGYTDIVVEKASVQKIKKEDADLFIVESTLQINLVIKGIKNYLLVNNILDQEELESKLIPRIEKEGK